MLKTFAQHLYVVGISELLNCHILLYKIGIGLAKIIIDIHQWWIEVPPTETPSASVDGNGEK